MILVLSVFISTETQRMHLYSKGMHKIQEIYTKKTQENAQDTEKAQNTENTQDTENA